MKQIAFSSLLIFTLMSLLSCKKDKCENIVFANKNLDPVSKTFETFNSAKTLIYSDLSGNEYRYELAESTHENWPNFKETSCDEEKITVRFDSEHHLIRFNAPNKTSIVLVNVAGFLDGEKLPEENRIVDILKLSIFNLDTIGEPLGRICVITSDRGGAIDKNEFNSGEFIVHDSLVILNKKFYNVYEQKNGANKSYYSPTIGVLSFTDNQGVQVVLDHVE